MDLDRKLNAALNLFQELIPELFYLPEMFVNSNNVSLHLILLSYVRQRSLYSQGLTSLALTIITEYDRVIYLRQNSFIEKVGCKNLISNIFFSVYVWH